MKVLYKIIIFLILYALLAIPDNRNSLHIPDKNALALSSKWWGKFAQNLVKFRITNSKYQEYHYNKHRSLLIGHLDELLLELTEPDDPILDSISYHINKLSALASLVPNKIFEYESDVAKWRKLLKYQSRYWDTSSKKDNERLFQFIIESRLAFESALIQSNTKSTHLSTSEAKNESLSFTKGSIHFNAGDVIAFNLISAEDPYTSFIRELPNVYKHLGSVYIKDTVASIIYIDQLQGLIIMPLDTFIDEVAPNGAVLRLRHDIPDILSNPRLPELAASTMYQMAVEGSYKYDHRFDFDSHDYLYDWEFINMAYKIRNFNIDANQLIGDTYSMHVGNHNAHINAFEIELDHRFELAGEWYNTELLYNNRLMTAATASIIHSKKKGDFINPLLLPLYRIVKGYSMFIGQFGLKEPIPEGVTAQAQLVYNALAKEQKNLVAKLESQLAIYEINQNHRATYLKMLQKADEINAEHINN